MLATIGHGLPFAFFEINGGAARISVNGSLNVWHNSNGVLGITVDGRHYGIFAPHGSSWTGTSTLESTLNGQNYLSVAVLPNSNANTLEFYRARAYAHVTDSKVEWSYDETTMLVRSELTYETVLREDLNGNLNETITALYPHQWKHTDAELTTWWYNSRAGRMKVLGGNSFATTVRFDGVIPSMPDLGTYDRATLLQLVQNESQSVLRPVDTYNSGKEMGRMARLIHIADQLGADTQRDLMLSRLKGRMQDWLTAGGEQRYVYNATWNVLTGYPSSFGADREINDHSFHAGYAVMAAATIAQYDPEWARQENWGGMVNLIIRDANNWEREDTRFPFLRGLNPYAGHSWASGHADFNDGNNQESSSESMHFASAVVLWGAMTGQDDLRDLGIYLHATERTAVEQYWFNVDGDTFPAGYPHTALGIVWGGKGTYGTWFGANPEFIHGINFLPITGGSLYLGRHPDYVLRNVAEIVQRTGGNPTIWRDVIWNFLALSDPDRAMNERRANPNYAVFDGESRAHTYHWIGNLQGMGQLDTTVTAAVPLAAVFRNEAGERSYVAFNTLSQETLIAFSDGFELEVPARTLGYAGGITPEPVSVAHPDERITRLELLPAYPNPFNPSTTIRFELPERMQVVLEVYTMAGQRVATLTNAALDAGSHQATFNGAGLASGIYIYRLSTPAGQRSRTITLLK